MKKILVVGLMTMIFLGCARNPVTHRSELSLVPNNEVLSLSSTSYKDFLAQHKLSTDAEKTAMVKRVGLKIQMAVTDYLNKNNLSKELEGYAWEFNLVEDPQVNAWCMPGGKVVVYTGLLPVAQDENGLATVLGHEIAHAIAKHGNERMSQGLIQQLGGVALQVALSNKPSTTQNLFYAAYGAGSQVGVILPFSRTQEAEADHMGLIFMAMAGYDPQTALTFWQRMAASSKGAPPEFLSDHPADATRIKNIEKEMPEAMGYYNASKKTSSN
ncbi:MAG: M48 family metallopeptidase [Cytophagaceae bacterium]